MHRKCTSLSQQTTVTAGAAKARATTVANRSLCAGLCLAISLSLVPVDSHATGRLGQAAGAAMRRVGSAHMWAYERSRAVRDVTHLAAGIGSLVSEYKGTSATLAALLALGAHAYVKKHGFPVGLADLATPEAAAIVGVPLLAYMAYGALENRRIDAARDMQRIEQ